MLLSGGVSRAVKAATTRAPLSLNDTRGSSTMDSFNETALPVVAMNARRGVSEGLEETEAIEAFRAGQVAVFEWLVVRYMGKAVSIARGMLRSSADAEDLAQDAFIRAWNSRQRFRSGDRFGPWFYRIVTNLALDLLKHRRRVREESIEVTHPSSAIQPDSLAEGQMIAGRIRLALDQLPPMQRLVASLFLVDGFDHGEIAVMTSLSEGTIRSHLSHARGKLRESLGALAKEIL
jgi:RNA polymerase sigma-70 factor (ECF subfamily)